MQENPLVLAEPPMQVSGRFMMSSAHTAMWM